MAKGETEKPEGGEPALKVGDAIQVEWYGSWWPAEVVSLRKDGRVKIHYSGWGSSWDEVVPRSRIRTGGEAIEEDEGGAVIHAGPVASPHLGQPLPGKPVSASTPLKAGDRVLAEQYGSWWAAEVLGVQDGGRVKIHYVGWESSWDEVVPRGRLRLEGPSLWETLQGKRLTLYFGSDWSLEGTLVEETGDYLVLSLPDGVTRSYVTRQRVVYFEAGEDESPPG